MPAMYIPPVINNGINSIYQRFFPPNTDETPQEQQENAPIEEGVTMQGGANNLQQIRASLGEKAVTKGIQDSFRRNEQLSQELETEKTKNKKQKTKSHT